MTIRNQNQPGKKTPSAGAATKQRILESASVIFAESGFRDATVQEICGKAEANVAAINYHFGSKVNLYIEVWRSAAELLDEVYTKPVMIIADPVERLKKMIDQRVRQTFDDGPAGRLRKLTFREMSDPTASHDILCKSFIRPLVNLLAKTVAEITGTPESDHRAQRCAFSLHSQLVFLNVLRMKNKLQTLEFLAGPSKIPSEKEMSILSNHISDFVLGGIKATAKKDH